MKSFILTVVLLSLVSGCRTRLYVENNSNKNYYDFIVSVRDEHTRRTQLFAGKRYGTIVHSTIPQSLKLEWIETKGSDKKELTLSVPDWAIGQPEGIIIDIQPNDTFNIYQCDWQGYKPGE